MTTEKFLDFNGKKITLVNADGRFFIALKPICDILDIDWESQRQALERHSFLNSTTCILQVVATDKKQREMVCLPERYIYGWLLSMSPKTQDHLKYQGECYDILYNHFHNIVNNRMGELQKRQQLKDEYQQLHKNKMLMDVDYKRMVDIETTLRATNKSLNDFGSQLLSTQLTFPFT